MNKHNTPTPANKGRIIFITGASRSGTTMLSLILGKHKQILGLQELHYFGDLWDPQKKPEALSETKMQELAATLFARQEHGIWRASGTAADNKRAQKLIDSLALEERNAAGIFAAVLSELALGEGKEIACEQTPRNIYYAERLLELYPESHVIHIVRDPRAVLASQKNRWQMRRLGGKNVPLSELVRTWFNYHPFTMNKLWSKANNLAIALTGHPRFITLRFEDLVDDPSVEIQKLCDFLDLEFDQTMLDIPQYGSSTVKHGNAKTGIVKDVVNQWEKILSKGEIRYCEHAAAPLMKYFSYDPKMTGSLFSFSLLPSLLRYPVHLFGVVISNPRRAWIQLKALLPLGR